jgi:hypothetical protein
MPETSEPIFNEGVGDAYNIDPQGRNLKKGTRRAGKPSDNKTPLLFGMEEQQVLKPKSIKPGDLANELSGHVEPRRKKRPFVLGRDDPGAE